MPRPTQRPFSVRHDSHRIFASVGWLSISDFLHKRRAKTSEITTRVGILPSSIPVAHNFNKASMKNTQRAREMYELRVSAGRYRLDEVVDCLERPAIQASIAPEQIYKSVRDAVRSKRLKAYQPNSLLPHELDDLDFDGQEIEEILWNDLNIWLHENYCQIRFEFPDPTPSGLSGQKPTLDPREIAVDPPTTYRSAEINEASAIPPILGKQPTTSAGKLAIEAAWAIECRKYRHASAKEVMEQLQTWADDGSKPDVLMKSVKEKHGVQWLTSKGKSKIYDILACEKALYAWFKSRA